jgi:hypothetical protein
VRVLEMRSIATILLLLMLSGCSAMLVGADVQPAADTETREDEDSRKKR